MDSTQFEQFLETLDAASIHLDSYNNFILNELPLTVQNLVADFKTPGAKDTVEAGFKLEFFAVHIPRACALKNGEYQPIYPLTCRREKSSYMAPVYASVLQTIYDAAGKKISTHIVRNTIISQVPVMVGSVLCHSFHKKEIRDMESSRDRGGYFIINGVERVLVTQRRKCYNVPQVLKEGGAFTVNMRSMSKETSHSVLVEFSISEEGEIVMCKLPFISKLIALGALVRAFGRTFDDFLRDMGVTSITARIFGDKSFDQMKDTEALEYIGSFPSRKCAAAEEDETFEESEDESEDEEWPEDESDREEESAEQVLKKKTALKYAKQIIDLDIFPHLGINTPPDLRYRTVVSMVRHLLLARFGLTAAESKDNIFFHRFETSGILLSEIYKMLFRNFLNTYKKCARGCAITDLSNKMEMFMTKSIKGCMSTGKWGVKKGYIKQGVSQELSRQSLLGTQSHLHRLSLPVGKKGKNVQIRLINPSQFGFICLFETPEGQGCGVVLNFTASIAITKEYAAPEIRDIIQNHMKAQICPAAGSGAEVWVDNNFLFYVPDLGAFAARFKELRKVGVVPRDVSLYIFRDRYMKPYEARIFSDHGRAIRPLLDVAGDVVYIDACEVQNNVIAMKKEETKWDYCELHPTLLFSICAGCIPFSDHIQSPRIVYASSMIKQAIGYYTDNFPLRYDTSCEVLDYAQKSMVYTKIGKAFGMHDAPAGVNCVVAIATLGDWNSEDCVILNKGAIDRGLFSSTTFKSLTIEEYRTKSNSSRKFCVPPEDVRKPMNNYSLLDERGIVRKGSKVSKKDVIVGCIQEEIKKGDKTKTVVVKDCSELSEIDGVVHSVELLNTFTGNRIVKIVIKIRKVPERGDKFANINAQKGTCGIILSPEDMPFCQEDGIIPDIIVNPNALPSRMTISMPLEIILGQEAAIDGEPRDATPFEKIEGIGNVLAEHGYDRLGTKIMIDGTTGKPFKARIFMGVNYYQKLKHMVSNKISARNFGNVTVSTRQPVSGRQKKGGVRAGEMEVQGWLSHGVSDFLREKLFDCSDKFSVIMCDSCGAISNHKDQCSFCHGEVFETDLPYSSKIVLQILNMCSIGTNYNLKAI